MSDKKIHDPYFAPLQSSSFNEECISKLIGGKCVAVRVPDLISPEARAAALNALLESEFSSYGTERVSPIVMRFGVGVSDHRIDGRIVDSYWPAVHEAHAQWAALNLPFDPFQLCRDAIAAGWPPGVSVGSRCGRPFAPGVAREPNLGFRVHFDDASREFTEPLFDIPTRTQLAFNLYLSVPPAGGETVIWRHAWRPGDEAHRLPGSYGYAADVIGDAESFTLTPLAGEALLFNPRYFHAVRPSVGGRRIALGFSVGVTDTGHLITWG